MGLRKVMLEELRDLYSAENQLLANAKTTNSQLRHWKRQRQVDD